MSFTAAAFGGDYVTARGSWFFCFPFPLLFLACASPGRGCENGRHHAEPGLFRLRPAVRAERHARPVQVHLPRRFGLPRLHLQYEGEMVLPQVGLRDAEAVQRRGRRQGRHDRQRSGYRRAAGTGLPAAMAAGRSRKISRPADQWNECGRRRRARGADGGRRIRHADRRSARRRPEIPRRNRYFA
jgi:hypothetical protein